MKKSILNLAVVLACVCGCNKSLETVDSEPLGREMSINLSIDGDAQTRSSYTWDEDNKVIKGEWKAGDKVSVITINSVGTVLSNDIFTATESGTDVSFTGIYTGKDNVYRTNVYYPAMTEKNVALNDAVGYGYHSDDYSLDGESLCVLSATKSFARCDFSTMVQAADDDRSHLSYSDLMKGEIKDIANPTATLKKFTGVFRLELTMPSNFMTTAIGVVFIRFSSSVTGQGGWFYHRLLDDDFNPGNSATAEARIHLGHLETKYHVSGIEMSAGEKLVVYVPFIHSSVFRAGGTITVGACDKDGQLVLTKVMTTSEDKEYKIGLVHNFKVALQ